MTLLSVLTVALLSLFLSPTDAKSVSAPRTAAPAIPSLLFQASECPSFGIDIWPGDDITAVVNGADESTIFCVHGAHRADEALSLKNAQILWGEDDASISGAEELTGWQIFEAGVWVYTGPLGSAENILDIYADSGGVSCYEVSTYADDVFYDDQRMMRVLSLDQLRGQEELPPGQAETEAEFGRFYFDYANDAIYVDEDPTAATVDMAVLDVLIESSATDVRIFNITLEKAISSVVAAQGATGWWIKDSTIRFSHGAGIKSGWGEEGDPFAIVGSLITNNGQAGIIGPASYLDVRGSEISWNNIANYRTTETDGECGTPLGTGGIRVFGADAGSAEEPSLRVFDADVHHNLGAGIHVDIHGRWISVAGSRLYSNEKAGFAQEISCEAEIAFNEFTDNGLPLKNEETFGGAVIIVLSNYVNVHHNLFQGNGAASILLLHEEHDNMTDVPCMDVAHDTDISDALKHNTIEANLIQMCGGVVGGVLDTDLADRDNWFIGNRYRLPDTSGLWWHDAEDLGFLTWDDWRAGGQDLTGAVVQDGGCQE